MVDYQQQATEARKKVLELIYKAGTSHIGSNFSVIDILTVLFDKVDIENDEVILSAGWKAAAWYYFLWKKGVITEHELNSYCQEGSPFIGLVEPLNRWGLRFAGGSMGYGLPAGVGFALSKKMRGEEGNVYVVMSDGELQCGTTHEAMLIAAQYNLDNLFIVIDLNGFQAMGEIGEILGNEKFGKIHDIRFAGYYQQISVLERFRVSGWLSMLGGNGHNFSSIRKGLFGVANKDNLPYLVVFNTVKGCGVSFMENNNDYHYLHVTDEVYEKALKELNA